MEFVQLVFIMLAKMFAVTDTGTTGLNPHENRIIEIAIPVYEQGKVAAEFLS